MIPSPQLVEMLGHLGFDWVLIDCEHSANSLEQVETLAMAAAAGIVRLTQPPTSASAAITQVLDRGVAGVQVPHIGSEAEAYRVVQAARYAPVGNRELAVGTRSAGYGLRSSLKDFVAEAKRDALVCVQLEDSAALRELDVIAAVEGVTCSSSGRRTSGSRQESQAIAHILPRVRHCSQPSCASPPRARSPALLGT